MSNFFTNSSGEALAQETEVSVSTVQRIIPEGTTLEITVTGVDIEPADNYGNNEYLVVNTIVTQKCEYSGIEVRHKLHINADKETKADKAKSLLLAYDSNIKGHLFKAASEGKEIVDQGLLNRALNGGQVSATYAEWSMPIKFNDENGNLQDAMDDDGQPMMRRGNWIKGIGPKAKAQEQQDAAIMQQANNQPNAPQVDPVHIQQSAPAAQPVQQPIQASIADAEIPF